MIRHVIDRYDKPIPAILEIPSKDHPYDPNKDSILRRAKVGVFESCSAYLTLSATCQPLPTGNVQP